MFNQYPRKFSYVKNATKVQYDHHSFGSKLEAAVYQHLKAREQNGEITDIKCQECVYLTDARIMFKPDFSYINVGSNEKVYAEAKGFETAIYRIKRRLWKVYGPAKLFVYKGSAKRVSLFEVITPGGNLEPDAD